jgi:hypothetical protein
LCALSAREKGVNVRKMQKNIYEPRIAQIHAGFSVRSSMNRTVARDRIQLLKSTVYDSALCGALCFA